MKDVYKSISGFLPPVFNLDPMSERSIQISASGNLREVTINDYVLKIFTDANSYPDIKIDLRGKTIGEVVDLIDAVDNLSAALIANGDKSALRLVKPENDWDDTEPIVDPDD